MSFIKPLYRTTLIYLIFFNAVSAQNLVPNPSFEDFKNCPGGFSEINQPFDTIRVSVISWYRPTVATSDYFNSCASRWVSVPRNSFGEQAARTGNAYIGFYVYLLNSGDYREFIEAQLEKPLHAGHKYHVSYWLSLGDYAGFALDQMGAFFTADSLYDPSGVAIIAVKAQVTSPKKVIYKDSTGWQEVSGEFAAAGGERWVTIGNFTPTADLNLERWEHFNKGDFAYYYLDDVCILDLDSITPDNILIRDTVGCDGTPMLLQGRTAMSNYAWNDGSTLPSRLINRTGTYWVRYIDKEHCTVLVDSFYVHTGSPVDSFHIGNDTALCSFANISLTPVPVPGNGVFRWSDGSNGASLTAIDSGKYWLEVKDGCYMYSDTVTIVVAPLNLHLVTVDTLVCEGAQVQIVAEGSDLHQYQWIPKDGVSDPDIRNPVITVNEPNIYTLMASHPGCKDTSVMIAIGMQQNPVVDLGPNQVICEGVTIALESNVRPYRNDHHYQWEPKKLGLGNSPNITFLADSTITYALIVKTPIGCTGTDSVQLTVIPGNFGSIIADTGYCPPDTLLLWAKGGTSYLWSPSYGLNDITLANPQAHPLTPAKYKVLIKDEHGCMDSLEVSIEVWPLAVLTMEDSINLYPGEVYHLQPGTNCHYFHWFPPSGMSNTEVADPWLSPEVRTRYFVTAVTEHGCILKDSIDVLVNCTVMDMPNAFTPASAGNNIFKVAIRGIAELKHFMIFNRWGNKVFETNNILEGWDGTFKGQAQPVGVYVYSIEGTSECGLPYYKEGNVTLLR